MNKVRLPLKICQAKLLDASFIGVDSLARAEQESLAAHLRPDVALRLKTGYVPLQNLVGRYFRDFAGNNFIL